MPASMTLDDAVRRAAAAQAGGRLDEAEHLYRAIVAAAPTHFASLQMLGVLAAQRGRLDEALQWLARALDVQPTSADAHSDRGSVLHLMGRQEEAWIAIEQALALAPDHPGALGNRAAVATKLGRHRDALAACDRALARDPRWTDAWTNRGVALMALDRPGEALASFERALALRPGAAMLLHNRATALLALGRPAEALADCERALAHAPRDADVLDTRGVALHTLGRPADALASFERALAAQPSHRRALANRLQPTLQLGRFDLAAPALAQAIALDPDVRFAHGLLLYAHLNLGDWGSHDAERDALVEGVRASKPVTEPFPFAMVNDSTADALACASITTALLYPPMPHPLWTGARPAHDRVRIAYLSADWHDHATAYLLAEVLERHDRARFAVTALSWGPPRAGAMRARIANACERFVDAAGWDDATIARWLHAEEIDIAVDLKGHTLDGRPGILAHRPAPVQVNYLGFPGTLGAAYVDYIIADATVVPPGADAHYRERVVRLPDTYQPNDRRRAIAAGTPARDACGLPDAAFVFCSFNATCKILPAKFDTWMRLLREVDGSVLWLLDPHPDVAVNLRREAQARGVDGARLVFAPRLPLAEHLARHRLADLFLDTLPYNAHTTASDALWAGLPVLTCLGHTFAGRVAGSLVRAAGLPELVVESTDAYVALALQLARDPSALSALRGRLAANRLTCALFDSERYTRHLETAYATMHARAQAGQPPASLAVARQTVPPQPAGDVHV